MERIPKEDTVEPSCEKCDRECVCELAGKVKDIFYKYLLYGWLPIPEPDTAERRQEAKKEYEPRLECGLQSTFQTVAGFCRQYKEVDA